MDDTPPNRPSAPRREHEADVYHVYVRHDDVAYFLAPDGTYVPELEKGRAFDDIQDAFDIVNKMTNGRNLSRKDEPGVVFNAWKWMGTDGVKPD